MIPKCIGGVLDHVRHLYPATCGISCARSYRTLRDGSFEGRFLRHFVPGYDQPVTPGQSHSPIEGTAAALLNNSTRNRAVLCRLDESIEIKVGT